MAEGVHPARGDRARRRLAAALVASLAAHGLLGALALRLGPREPPPRRAPIVVELELVEEAPRAAMAHAPDPRSRAHTPPRRAGAGAAPTQGEPVPGEAPPSASGADVAAWFEQHGLGAAPGAPALAVRPHGIAGVDADRAPAGAADDGGDTGERARRRIDRIVGEARASDLARYPDARWTGLRDRMAAGFSPPEELLPRSGSGRPAPLEAWSRAAERYGHTGSPESSASAEGPGAEVAREGAERLGFGEGAVALLRLGGTAAAPGVLSRLVTLVAVEQGEDGRVVRVWLLGSSGDLAHDRLAVDRARRIRGTPGLDLPHVGRSDWAFTSELVEPPGGLFDANFRPVPARDRRPRVRTHVELVAIWMPARR